MCWLISLHKDWVWLGVHFCLYHTLHINGSKRVNRRIAWKMRRRQLHLGLAAAAAAAAADDDDDDDIGARDGWSGDAVKTPTR